MNWLVKIALLTLILLVGTLAALFAGETRGLALNDFSDATVDVVAPIASNGSLLAAFSGNQRGIFRSDDGGLSWERISAGPDVRISALAVNPAYPNIVFAGTAGQSSNLWYSDDGGRTWDSTLFGLPADELGQSPEVRAISSAPSQPNLMYLGTWGQGLYRFDVREGKMERLGGNTLAKLYVNQIVTRPDGPMYAVTTEGLLHITGKQIEKIKTPDGVVSMAIHPVKPQTIYVGTVGYGLHRSTDGGQSWQALNNGLGLQPGVILRVPAIVIDSQNPQHLAVSTAFGVGSRLVGDGIFESIDAGQSWQRIAKLDEIVDRITIEDGGVYAATSHGLVRYGQSLPAADPGLWQRAQSLTSPTTVQLVILALTLGVGGWVLFARLSWSPVRIK